MEREEELLRYLAKSEFKGDIEYHAQSFSRKEPESGSSKEWMTGLMTEPPQTGCWSLVEVQEWENLSSLPSFAKECSKQADCQGAIFASIIMCVTEILS